MSSHSDHNRIPVAARVFLRCAASGAVWLSISFFLPVVGGERVDDSSPIERVDFNRDVRPILAKHCFACHGPDEEARESGLRLDTQSGSREDLGGYQAVVPAKPHKSALLLRVTSDDVDLRMPPAESHPALGTDEIRVLRHWIQRGGEYSLHWAFRKPKRPAVPAVEDAGWCRGPVDRFVLRRLEQAGLSPGEMADSERLIRRVSMDLVGIPPDTETVTRFLRDPSDHAYEQLVDRLLASPSYGERFATPWLDLARYSDTNGYEKDRPRTIWPYRDWVINALNEDKPFDQFSIEQLAGDMLPRATRSQRIATGFHRNTMLNEEGGIDPLEFRYHAMVDRVATTGTVWMGLTTGCAQCHTHKYDPITHTDYYAMMALLDNADEPELGADHPSVIGERERLTKAIREQELEIVERVLLNDTFNADQEAFTQWASQQRSQASRWTVCRPRQMESSMPLLSLTDEGSILASGDATKREVYTLNMPPLESDKVVTAIRLEALSHESLPARGPGLAYYEGRRGDFFLSELKLLVNDRPVELSTGTTSIANAKPGNGKTFPGNVTDDEGFTGWSIPGEAGQTHRLVLPLAQPLRLDQTWTLTLLFERHYVAGLGHFRIDVTTDDAPIALAIPSRLEHRLACGEQSPDLNRSLALEYLRTAERMKPHRKTIDTMRSRIPKPVRTFVMQERPASNPRVTRRHHRGEYLQPREVVEPSILELFAEVGETSEGKMRPRNRLEFAHWLVSDANPLVGRVTVNRAWRSFFGAGIVRTAGDFGTQSEPPSHPELLDYLSDRLQGDSPTGMNWSLKKLHRQIVLSSTYRLAVGKAPEEDPDNRLLSVFPYRRYDPQRIRDAFLAAANLLVNETGGPSVYPPQPATVMQIAYGKPKWPTATGKSRFRRSLYTFSKRTAPFAAYATFDAPSGEQCIARRESSTTPLQALTLLNDAMYLEIAREFAKSVVEELGPAAEDNEIAGLLFRRLLTREPTEIERTALVEFYRSQTEHPDPWMLVARVLMNTDEAITVP
ncbi:MAG: PSD1 and planctomycete cytochrome C domain-containing protein [Planctomycetota bacterium]